ncbi:MAG: polyribonucleotide nucleotidyltransferase [Acidimicrobiia bacterium]|nr:polyribonucleotide nucleotidyltransferase [Acidimicrobiia bacterium]MYI18989.1 polyribonucleotide nucleotidyltransferase [Acidimicrobiia bacterium]
MNEAISVSGAIGGADGKEMTLETGRLAALAGGAVLARLGRTEVLVTATASESAREGANFFPLTVDIEERMFSAGKIPGSFFRREGRASEQATLACRLIDRPLRPAFPDGFRNDVHVVGIVLGADQQNPYDVLALNAASAALGMSGIPFGGPVGAVRIGYSTDGQWIPHPTYPEADGCTFEMVVAGRVLADGDVAVMMVEAAGTPGSVGHYEAGAPKVDEAVLAEGLEASKRWVSEAVALQRRLIAMAGVKPTMDFELMADYSPEVAEAVAEIGRDQLAEALEVADKTARLAAERSAAESIIAAVAERFEGADGIEQHAKSAVRSLSKSIVRERILGEGRRIDGRGTSDLRPLSAEVGVIAMTHGSGLFQRGETQVLNVTTLGTQRMDQIVDGIDPTERKRYLHHYNFPPFSTGEAGFMRGPRRREIGHGALAEKALLPVVPGIEEFPYTIRLVSEVLASNGSSSMASVCGSSLSLMDAGVPIKAPVAGIAMGLINEGDRYVALTDILGAEDAFGDMDFKVAGTEEYVTALQLDTKIDGIPASVLAAALEQARDARLQILEVMRGAIDGPRPDVGETAPKILSFEIPTDKIGEVIGPKGKVINALQEETGAEIMVDEDATGARVAIAAADRAAVASAEERIRAIVFPPEVEIGAIYTGRVVNITGFGAFVNILPGRDGLVHISKLGGGRRLDRVEEVLSLDDEITVRVDQVDGNNRISLIPVGGDDDGSDGAGAQAERGGSERRQSDRRDGGRGGRDGGRDRGRDGGRDGGRDRGRDGGRDGGRGGRERQAPRSDSETSTGIEEVSFAEEFDRMVAADFGDLGPADAPNRPRRRRN